MASVWSTPGLAPETEETQSVTNARLSKLVGQSSSSHQPREGLSSWQTDILECIMNLDVAGVTAVARRINDESKMRMKIHVKTVSRKYLVFSFAEEMFSPTGGIRHIFGGTFKFEHEEVRAEVGSWLEMIGAKNGDSLLHLALRLNGCEYRDQVRNAPDSRTAPAGTFGPAACICLTAPGRAHSPQLALVVELLGQGCDFEAENDDRELPAMLDPVRCVCPKPSSERPQRECAHRKRPRTPSLRPTLRFSGAQRPTHS